MHFSLNSSEYAKDNYGSVNVAPKVIHRQPVYRLEDNMDKKVPQSINNDNSVSNDNIIREINSGISNINCRYYCIPLLILVCIVSLSVLVSLFTDTFKSKKITLNLLIGVIVNIAAVVMYSTICNKCGNDNMVVNIIITDLLPWVIYILLIGLIYMYITNRIIKK